MERSAIRLTCIKRLLLFGKFSVRLQGFTVHCTVVVVVVVFFFKSE